MNEEAFATMRRSKQSAGARHEKEAQERRKAPEKGQVAVPNPNKKGAVTFAAPFSFSCLETGCVERSRYGF
jgi:hypothetical protein